MKGARRVIGLTGGLGSGKSTALKILKRLGIKTADADDIVHDLMRPGRPGHAKAVRFFGPRIVNPDKTLNRSLMAKIVFHYPRLRKKWEKIIHPLVVKELRKKTASVRRGVLVLDIPLLYEARLGFLADEVWVVWAPLHVRLARLKKARRFSRADALRRIKSQMSLDAKRRRADQVLNNGGSIWDLRRQVKNLLSINTKS